MPEIEPRLIAEGVVAIGSLLAGIVSLMNRNAIKEVHLTMNSRLDALIEATRAMAFAEGRAAHTSDQAQAAAEVLDKAASSAATVLQTAAKKAE